MHVVDHTRLHRPRAGTRHADLPTDLPPNAGRAAAGVAIVLVAQLMLVLDATVVNVALPRIDADLGFGPAVAVVGAQRLHAGLRRPAAARRSPRRRPRPAAHLRGRPGALHRRLRRSAASPRPRPCWSPPAPPRASAPRWPHPACSPCSPPAPPTRRRATARSPCSAPSPRAACPSACCSAASSPTSARGAGRCSSTSRSGWPCCSLTRRFVDRDPAPPRPLRRRRRRHRHPRRGLARLGADRRPRARLDLGPHPRRVRRRRRAARPARPHRAPGRAPDAAAPSCCATGAGSPRSP